MNLITADFNWISFLIIIVATVIGMVKSNSKKNVRKPAFPMPDFEPYQNEEEYTISDNMPIPVESFQDESAAEEPQLQVTPTGLPGDHYKDSIEKSLKDSPIYASVAEEEKESLHWDLRQAIISSEILRRPEF